MGTHLLTPAGNQPADVRYLLDSRQLGPGADRPATPGSLGELYKLRLQRGDRQRMVPLAEHSLAASRFPASVLEGDADTCRLAVGVGRRRRLVLDDENTLRQGRYRGIVEGPIAVVGQRHAAMYDPPRDRHRQGEAQAKRSPDALRGERRRPEERVDVDALDLGCLEPRAQPLREVFDKVERAMGIATGGEALEIVAQDPPGPAELGRHQAGIVFAPVDVAHDRGNGIGLAREASVAQAERLVAGPAAVTRVDVAHGGAVVERLAAAATPKVAAMLAATAMAA